MNTLTNSLLKGALTVITDEDKVDRSLIIRLRRKLQKTSAEFNDIIHRENMVITCRTSVISLTYSFVFFDSCSTNFSVLIFYSCTSSLAVVDVQVITVCVLISSLLVCFS
jgi:hypothetical protein